MNANARDSNFPEGVVELRFVSDGPMILLADRRCRKDIIPTGTHVYRAKNAESGKLERCELVVPESRIDHWVESGNAMLSAGVEIPMPLDHDVDNSERNRGFVRRFFKERKSDGRAWLWCEGEIPDVPGSAYVGKTIREVSAGVARTLEKAGKIWDDVVAHVSPCINPVIIGQGNFVTLKQITGSEPFSGGQGMDELMKMMQGMGDLAKQAGVDLSDLTPENALEKMKALLAWCSKQTADDAAAEAEMKSKLEAATGDVAKLKADLVTSTGQVVELKSKYEPETPTPTAEEIRLKAELETERKKNRDRLVADVDAEVQELLKDQKIVAADAPKWAALLRGPKADSGMVCLKETEADKSVVETEASVADTVRTLLKNLPKGAALAGRSPGGKPQELPAEGEDATRAELKDKALEISKRDGITFEQALPKAEAELKQK